MLTSLASSNPPLALVLQTIRLRVLLRQNMAAASLSPAQPGRPTDAVQYRSEALNIPNEPAPQSSSTIGWFVALAAKPEHVHLLAKWISKRQTLLNVASEALCQDLSGLTTAFICTGMTSIELALCGCDRF